MIPPASKRNEKIPSMLIVCCFKTGKHDSFFVNSLDRINQRSSPDEASGAHHKKTKLAFNEFGSSKKLSLRKLFIASKLDYMILFFVTFS